jgi:ubiquinone/menaquinone biosynthesis C-methylase UbiE
LGRGSRLLGLAAISGAAAVFGAWRLDLLGRGHAWLYDSLQSGVEREFLGVARKGLLASARGRVLDVGCGTGANLAHYPRGEGLEIVAVEPDRAMLDRARRRAGELGMTVDFREIGAYPLPFPAESFDTAVFTLCLCTIPDPAAALAEARRVLRPGGKILFLEHVRAKNPGLAAWQDRLERPWMLIGGGCHPNRDTRSAIEAAGFQIDWIAERDEQRIPIPIVRPGIMGAALTPAS